MGHDQRREITMGNKLYAAVAFAVVIGAQTQAVAQAPAGESAAQVGRPSGAAKGAIEPGAMAALDRMGSFLRNLRAFQVQADISADDVLVDGEKVQFDSTANLIAQRPDRLRLEITSARQHRFFFFDGKQFTLWAPRTNFYTTVPAPPNISELADELEAKYAIELPLVDLFRWGGPRSDSSAITAAKDIGPSEVGGTTCEHYAFRQNGLDWQIWIQNGDYPLPRKVVLTTTTDEARPQYVAVYTWNLAPSFNAGAFTFAPPSDARRIPIQEVVPPKPGGSNR
jgi:hypothetical protein